METRKNRVKAKTTNNNADDYDQKYMKMKFLSDDDDLPLKKTLELHRVKKSIR